MCIYYADMHEGHNIRYTNHDRSPAVLNSHRILWPRRVLLRHPGLLNFAKRLTRVSNPVKDLSIADFYTTADVPSSAPYSSRESPSPSPSPPRQDGPIVAPSSQRSRNHSNSQPPSPTPVPGELQTHLAPCKCALYCCTFCLLLVITLNIGAYLASLDFSNFSIVILMSFQQLH